jgi:hypothetical protein
MPTRIRRHARHKISATPPRNPFSLISSTPKHSGVQAKWDHVQLEYEGILEKDPNAPGIHFLFGRLLLSRPNAGPDVVQRAKQEFQKEIEIDPKNAVAPLIRFGLPDALAFLDLVDRVGLNFAELLPQTTWPKDFCFIYGRFASEPEVEPGVVC